MADEPWPALARHLDQRDPRIVHAAAVEAGEIDGLTSIELCVNCRKPFRGEMAVEAMNRSCSKVSSEERTRDPIGRIGKPLMAWSNSHFQHAQATGSIRSRFCRHLVPQVSTA